MRIDHLNKIESKNKFKYMVGFWISLVFEISWISMIVSLWYYDMEDDDLFTYIFYPIKAILDLLQIVFIWYYFIKNANFMR